MKQTRAILIQITIFEKVFFRKRAPALQNTEINTNFLTRLFYIFPELSSQILFIQPPGSPV